VITTAKAAGEEVLRCRTIEGYRTVLKHARKGNRIEAIKALKAETGCSLAVGKAAVECAASPDLYAGPRILPPLHVKSITLVVDTGEVTVDLEGLQLLGLMRLESVGLEDCRSILRLVEAIQGWQSGNSGATPVTPGDVSP
jgi:hypothetical protein